MSGPQNMSPYPPSTFITGIAWSPEIVRLGGERTGDNWPLTWGDEMLGYLLVATVMAGAAEALRRGDHIAIDLVTSRLTGRARRAAGAREVRRGPGRVDGAGRGDPRERRPAPHARGRVRRRIAARSARFDP